MPIRINVNGAITPPEDARVSVLDHGYLFGDSIFETLRTHRGRPFLFSRHYARLEHSARGVSMPLKWSRQETFDQTCRTTREASESGECRIRIMVTRGIGDLTLDTETCGEPTIVIIASPLTVLPDSVYVHGVDVVISSWQRGGQLADLKTGSLMTQVVAFREARMKQAFEAIMLTPDGHVSDGITCNIYMVRNGRLNVPSLKAGILEGITRGVVLDIARQIGLDVHEGLFPAGDIQRAEEMFLTSSTRGIVPIARVDARQIGTSVPGPVTSRILAAYQLAIDRLIEES